MISCKSPVVDPAFECLTLPVLSMLMSFILRSDLVCSNMLRSGTSILMPSILKSSFLAFHSCCVLPGVLLPDLDVLALPCSDIPRSDLVRSNLVLNQFGPIPE